MLTLETFKVVLVVVGPAFFRATLGSKQLQQTNKPCLLNLFTHQQQIFPRIFLEAVSETMHH